MYIITDFFELKVCFSRCQEDIIWSKLLKQFDEFSSDLYVWQCIDWRIWSEQNVQIIRLNRRLTLWHIQPTIIIWLKRHISQKGFVFLELIWKKKQRMSFVRHLLTVKKQWNLERFHIAFYSWSSTECVSLSALSTVCNHAMIFGSIWNHSNCQTHWIHRRGCWKPRFKIPTLFMYDLDLVQHKKNTFKYIKKHTKILSVVGTSKSPWLVSP